MTELIKEFGNLSLGAGALVALIVVIFKQMDLLKEMRKAITENTQSTNQNTITLQALCKNVEANTVATSLISSHLKHKN